MLVELFFRCCIFTYYYYDQQEKKACIDIRIVLLHIKTRELELGFLVVGFVGQTMCSPSYLPVYNPNAWNAEDFVTFNNCYAYAFEDRQPGRDHKPSPGERSALRFRVLHPSDYSCPSLKQLIGADYPGVIFQYDNGEIPCPCGYYKAFVATTGEVYPARNRDYHLWRQDRNTMWSHKPGSWSVTDRDGGGQRISNPLYANRKHGDIDYKIPCGFLCIPSRYKSE